MASGGVPYEEHFCCCICLDLFTAPVTLPCGHNFCKTCISQHWACSGQQRCALCKELFNQRPDLRVNTTLAQMTEQLKNTSQKSIAEDGENDGEDGEDDEGHVRCDVCSRRRAVKSCLVCLTSFCEEHLRPHYKSPGLRRHQLMEPVNDLEERTCPVHNRPRRFFCQTEQICICQFCSETHHLHHAVVSTETEARQKRQEMSKLQGTLWDMSSKRREKIKQLNLTKRASEDTSAEDIRDSVQAVFKVTRSLEKGLSKIIDTIENKQKAVERQTQSFVLEIENEICEIMNARAELEQHKSTKDDFWLVQNFESLKILPKTQDWSKVQVQTFQKSIIENVSAQMEEIEVNLEKLWLEVDLKSAQQFATDVTFDPETAYPALILSENGKKVTCGNVDLKVSKNPKRFTKKTAVLGKQGVSSGKFYFDVWVGTKERWDVGFVSELVDRNEDKIVSPNFGYWVIWLRSYNEYKAMVEPAKTLIPNSKPENIGVLLDYEEGTISFYNTETAEMIYRYEKC